MPVRGDTADEDDETFFVNLSIPTNATISDAQATGTENQRRSRYEGTTNGYSARPAYP